MRGRGRDVLLLLLLAAAPVAGLRARAGARGACSPRARVPRCTCRCASRCSAPVRAASCRTWNAVGLLGHAAARRVPAGRAAPAHAGARPAAARSTAFQVLVLALARPSPDRSRSPTRGAWAPARSGPLLAALSFALGPYLVAQLADTATIVAAPALPADAARAGAAARSGPGPCRTLRRARRRGGAAAACRVARGVLARRCCWSRHGWGPRRSRGMPRRRAPVAAGPPGGWAVAAALAAGVLLAAPQLLPTLVAHGEAGGRRRSGRRRLERRRRTSRASSCARYRTRRTRSSYWPPCRSSRSGLACARGWRSRGGAGLVLAARGQLETPGPLALALDLALALAGRAVALDAVARGRRSRAAGGCGC